MINRVKRMLSRRQFATGLDAYFNSVQRHGGEGLPTFTEARKDFYEVTRWYSGPRN